MRDPLLGRIPIAPAPVPASRRDVDADAGHTAGHARGVAQGNPPEDPLDSDHGALQGAPPFAASGALQRRAPRTEVHP